MKDYVAELLPCSDAMRDLALAEFAKTHREGFYDIDTSREQMSPALSRTRTYHLRIPNVPRGSIQETTNAQDVLQCRDTKLFAWFPVMRQLIEYTAELTLGPGAGWTTLGRVFVTRLEAGASIGRHVDEGRYFDVLHRFHFVLEASDAYFCWDDTRTRLSRGELWKVNNSVPHWVDNVGIPRTHLIFDAC